MKYALKLACIPTVAILGVGIGELMGGAVFVEIIFNRPGLGSLIFDAIGNRNYPIVQGGILDRGHHLRAGQPAGRPVLMPWLDPACARTSAARAAEAAPDAWRCCAAHLEQPERPARADRHAAGDRSAGIAAPLIATHHAERSIDVAARLTAALGDATGWAPTSSAATCSRARFYGTRIAVRRGARGHRHGARGRASCSACYGG